MKIINDTSSENDVVFGQLTEGDTFFYRYSDGTYDREDVYVRMNSITAKDGSSKNAFRLKYNYCVNFSEDAPVKKIKCVVNVIKTQE